MRKLLLGSPSAREYFANRDLDALVAEKVMGWSGREAELWFDVLTGTVTGWGTENCHPATTDTMFRPSTEIRAALHVVERVKQILEKDRTAANGWPRHRIEIAFDIGDGLWSVTFLGLPVHGTSLPLTICKAALRVVNA